MILLLIGSLCLVGQLLSKSDNHLYEQVLVRFRPGLTRDADSPLLHYALAVANRRHLLLF